MGTQIGSPLSTTHLINLPGSARAEIASSRASIILERIIFYTLLVLIVVVATPYGIVSPWREVTEAVFECGIFALGILWMVEGILSGAWVSRRHLLLIPFLLFVAFAYIQTLPLGGSSNPIGISVPAWQAISFDPYETRQIVLKLLALSLALGLLLRYTKSTVRLRVLVFFVIGIGVASAMFALLRQTAQRDASEFLFPFVRLERGYGQFINRNHFAFLMEMALGLVLGLIAGGGVKRERLLIYLTAAIPMWVSLVLSNSRGGILSMLCQLLLLALIFSSVRSRERLESRNNHRAHTLTRMGVSSIFRLTLGVFLAAVTLIGVVWVGGEQIINRFEALQDEIAVEAQESNSGASRRETWGATWQLIKDNPSAGVGIGGYWTAIPQYHNASGRLTPQQAHNDYLELLASGGLIGVLIGVCFVILLVKFARSSLRSIDPFRRAACFGAVSGIFGISIHSLVDFGLHIPINALICLTLVVISTVSDCAEEEKSGRIERPLIKGFLQSGKSLK